MLVIKVIDSEQSVTFFFAEGCLRHVDELRLVHDVISLATGP
jgi:hypothetical protein